MTRVKRYWTALMTDLGVDRKTAAIHWLMLQELYGRPDRHYHNLKHIGHFLDALHKFGVASPALVLAAFYHDAIYDSKAKDNERRSADLARQFLTAIAAPPALAASVEGLILATEKHTVAEGISAAERALQQLFLDCDLLILGESARRYDSYAAQIRQEYIQFADADYRAGRAMVLAKFLKRERLYFSDTVRQKYEKRARANIRRELKNLQPS